MTATHHDTEPFEVLDPDPLRRVELAMADLRQGRMILLVDDEDRENEGDLVLAGERVTPEAINFMAVHARGLICLSMTSRQVQRLALPMMATNNQSPYNTAFTVSIEAREGVTTGISAADRARTVAVAIDEKATPRDIVTPGHMFPLRARDGGVLERVGQTEGSVDLCRLAGLKPAAVICEVMNLDGTMARMPELQAFGVQHHIRVCAVADVIKYRMRTERIVRAEAEGSMELPGLGTFSTRLYRGTVHGDLHLAMWRGALGAGPMLARVQAAPPAWASLDPDLNRLAQQARASQEAIAAAGGGVLILMHLDGGTPERIAQQFNRDFGGQTESTPQQRAAALRDLGTGCQILVDLGLRQLRLLSSSNRSIVGVEA